MRYDDESFSDIPQRRRLLPSWCWWLVVPLSAGDVATTLIARAVGLADRNPLYVHTSTASLPWVLLVTHAALLLLLALIARLHRRVGIVGALCLALLYLAAVTINTALLLVHLAH